MIRSLFRPRFNRIDMLNLVGVGIAAHFGVGKMTCIVVALLVVVVSLLGERLAA
jgi:hypothetical protein